MFRGLKFLLLLCLSGCVSVWSHPDNMLYTPVSSGQYQIATWSRMTDSTSPVHIYIEGDGYSFDARGRPTSDPTPRGTLVRDLASRDMSTNVVYMARPCQYIMSPKCHQSDWTDGRFSQEIVDSVYDAIRTVAGNRPIIMIGYSGGAMISGLVIAQHPELNVQKWITIAGVLNHHDWTEHFGDRPLTRSLDLEDLPDVPQLHYIAGMDRVVPNHLSYRWVSPENIIVESDATHTAFPTIKIVF